MVGASSLQCIQLSTVQLLRAPRRLRNPVGKSEITRMTVSVHCVHIIGQMFQMKTAWNFSTHLWPEQLQSKMPTSSWLVISFPQSSILGLETNEDEAQPIIPKTSSLLPWHAGWPRYRAVSRGTNSSRQHTWPLCLLRTAPPPYSQSRSLTRPFRPWCLFSAKSTYTHRNASKSLALYRFTSRQTRMPWGQGLGDWYTTLNTEGDSIPTEELWSSFKDTLHAGVQKHIPHKKVRLKESKSWITPAIRRLIKKRDRLYKKMRKKGREKYEKPYKDLCRQIQQQLRRSYWAYLNDIFEETDTNASGHTLNTLRLPTSELPPSR